MKKEIEVKVKVESFEDVLKKLIDLGCVFTDPVTQDDTIFINYDRPFIEFKTGDSFLRIRKNGAETIFTFKRGEEMNSIEREFIVSDAEQLKDTLIFLGYRPEVRVVKTRRKTKYEDYEICLDEVVGLGSFIELEKITDENSQDVQSEMMEFLKSLGIESKERVMNGYDTLTWLKDNSDYKSK